MLLYNNEWMYSYVWQDLKTDIRSRVIKRGGGVRTWGQHIVGHIVLASVYPDFLSAAAAASLLYTTLV